MKYRLITIPGMENFIEYIKNNKKTVTILLVGVLGLMLVQIVKGDNFNGKYVVNKSGNIVGIVRNDIKKGVSVPISVTANKGSKISERDIILYLQGESGKADKERRPKTKDDEIEEALDDTINKVEGSDDKIVKLPTTLDNGTEISWKKPKKEINISLIILFPAILYLLYRNEINKKKQNVKDMKINIGRALPMFNNQLLLLLNSGLIFNDAFYRIAEGYAKRSINEKMPLEKNIVDIYNRKKDTNSSLIALLNNYTKEIEVKELSRIVGIISDNQYKGVNLSEKLEAEGSILWENRKKAAEEKGKLAETKLTFPLAILLLVLIIITAAPAILQI